MELSSIISCLKHGRIPENLPTERYKWVILKYNELYYLMFIIFCYICMYILYLNCFFFTQAQMIIQMVQEDPVKRPWTKQLLQSLKEDEDMTITELKNTVGILKNDILNKDSTIQELEKKIALLKNEVKMLKDPLENIV